MKFPLPPRRVLPWRSPVAGWVTTALVLLVSVPPFLCMPPWGDVTHYDMCVRVVLRGGVYYRDVFDTNLPGVAWAMAAVRATLGTSYEVLRAVDLLIMATCVALLAGWVRRGGGVGYTVAWLAGAAALFYPSTSEFCHMQRDGWMLLPALVAARLRIRRVESAGGTRPEVRLAILEGVAWGCAVWIKPHVAVPAVFLWAASVVLIARRDSFGRVLADAGGLLLGGLLCGAAGVAWLAGTGAWPYFLDVFLEWNPNYVTGVVGEAGSRFDYTFVAFRPWGLLHFAAIPLAVLALWEGRAYSFRPGNPWRIWGRWVYAKSETESVASARVLLAAVYLGWLLQAVLFQKGFDYVQVPVTFLGMAVVATHRWAFGAVYLLWLLGLGAVLHFTTWVPPQDPPPGVPVLRLEPYPLTDPRVLGVWPRCWREGGTPELRDRLGQYTDIHCCADWEQLEDVAGFLRSVRPPLGNGELNCWHDSTHPLYLMLDLDPATRYMHYGTVMGINSPGDWIRERVRADVRKSRQRFVVADLARMTWSRSQPQAWGEWFDPRNLPRWFPPSEREKYPWNQRLAFRSGRYVVYEVVTPGALGEVGIPEWDTLDQIPQGD